MPLTCCRRALRNLGALVGDRWSRTTILIIFSEPILVAKNTPISGEAVFWKVQAQSLISFSVEQASKTSIFQNGWIEAFTTLLYK